MSTKDKDVSFDCSGYATKANLECSDGRTIRKDAFAHQNGMTVPLVWTHLRQSPSNVIGRALLENRADGMYAYLTFNEDVPDGRTAKALVKHGDITSLSIYANELKERSGNVLHGMIREVSLVLAGANPGAKIDNIAMEHEDGSSTSLDNEAIIYTDASIEQHAEKVSAPVAIPVQEVSELVHANKDSNTMADKPKPVPTSDKTIQEIYDAMTEEQQTVVHALVGAAVEATMEETNSSDKPVTHSEGELNVKKNAFDSAAQDEAPVSASPLSHSQINEFMHDAIVAKTPSFRAAIKEYASELGLMHDSDQFGITNISYLFPELRSATPVPSTFSRRMAWVKQVLGNTHHTPFSRIKSTSIDMTADDARARGYIQGNEKTDVIMSALRRATTPCDIIARAQLHRSDVLDITDFDVIAWMANALRVVLDEELARAILIGDGRATEDAKKIKAPTTDADGEGIRPIWTDSEVYAHHTFFESTDDAEEMIDAFTSEREYYYGAGNPILFTTMGFRSQLLLLKDTTGRRLYPNLQALADAIGVSQIVEVPIMVGQHRDVVFNGVTKVCNLKGILVDLIDYNVGADKGGELADFNFFDIDFNTYKYLLETRASGALIVPRSALVFEQKAS